MMEFLDQYGWWTAGLVLLIAEMLVPGIFLMWFGLAALLTGIVDVIVPDLDWRWQAIVFSALSVALVFGIRPLVGRSLEHESDRPDLNRRLHSLIGQSARLVKPIENGHGEVRIGDTVWRVTGPDLPAGTRVRVTAVNERAMALTVEPDTSA